MKKVLLILAPFVLLLSYCSYSSMKSQKAIEVADEFAINSALNVREHIIKESACPDSMTGWSKSTDYGDYKFKAWAGLEERRYQIFFKCDKSLEYDFILKYGMGSGIYLSGNGAEEIEITYGHFTDHKKLYVDENSDIKSIAGKLHDY